MDTKHRPGIVPARRTAEPDEQRRTIGWFCADGKPADQHYLTVVGEEKHEDGQTWFHVSLDEEKEKASQEQLRRDLGERLKALRGDTSRQDVAIYMGKHRNTIAKFERGEVLPDAWELMRLARLFGCTVEELLSGVGEPRPSLESTSPEFAMIPEYGVRASAGTGRLVEGEEIIGRFAFKRAWLASKGIKVENLAVISADGDSMEPTVRDADILLVDTSVHAIRADGIYLIEQAGELRCKRLQAMVDGGVKIRSDNPRYETEVVSPENAELLRVVAKVIWIGGER